MYGRTAVLDIGNFEKRNTFKLQELIDFIIKFPYNARSDWLKQRALSENRALVDDIQVVANSFQHLDFDGSL